MHQWACQLLCDFHFLHSLPLLGGWHVCRSLIFIHTIVQRSSSKPKHVSSAVAFNACAYCHKRLSPFYIYQCSQLNASSANNNLQNRKILSLMESTHLEFTDTGIPVRNQVGLKGSTHPHWVLEGSKGKLNVFRWVPTGKCPEGTWGLYTRRHSNKKQR